MLKRGKIKSLSVMLCAALLVLGMVSSASAIPYYFYKITNNGNTNVASQLSVDVFAGTGDYAGQVGFTFSNAGPFGSSITDIYFDDGTLLALSTIVNGPTGVSFVTPATPPDLPGGETVGFETTKGFSANSSTPITANGVNPGEYVSIYFTLQTTPTIKTYADTLAALADGSLRIGLHVQAIGGSEGGSDSYVNLVPEPYTLLLLGLGLVGVAGVRRFRK